MTDQTSPAEQQGQDDVTQAPASALTETVVTEDVQPEDGVLFDVEPAPERRDDSADDDGQAGEDDGA